MYRKRLAFLVAILMILVATSSLVATSMDINLPKEAIAKSPNPKILKNPYTGMYGPPNCTWYAWQRLHDTEKIDFQFSVTAVDWLKDAQLSNAFWSENTNSFVQAQINYTPSKGDIMVLAPNSYLGVSSPEGHVAYVENVVGDSIFVTEQNYSGSPPNPKGHSVPPNQHPVSNPNYYIVHNNNYNLSRIKQHEGPNGFGFIHFLSQSPTPTPSPTFTPTPTPSPSAWNIISSPNSSACSNSILSSISAPSPTDIWAVGYSACNSPQMLIEHWDGTQWNIIPGATLPSNTSSELISVSGLNASDVWIGGYSFASYPNYKKPFVSHWDGTQWNSVPDQIIQNLGDIGAIKEITINNVWVVGDYVSSHDDAVETITDHFDGTQWSIVPSPNITTSAGSSNYLAALSATSATDIWAVGNYEYFIGGGTNKDSPLIEHYDGTQWSIVPSPNITTPACVPNRCTLLTGVTATSNNDAWVVSQDGYISHWNGTQWSIAYTPKNGSIFVSGISASSSSNVWAVGQVSITSSTAQPFVEHWNGTQWTEEGVNPIDNNIAQFEAVVTLPNQQTWAVGRYIGGTLTELYS